MEVERRLAASGIEPRGNRIPDLGSTLENLAG